MLLRLVVVVNIEVLVNVITTYETYDLSGNGLVVICGNNVTNTYSVQPRSQDFCLGGAKPQDNFSDSVARSLRSHNTSSPLSTLDKNYISPRMLKSAIEFSWKFIVNFAMKWG